MTQSNTANACKPFYMLLSNFIRLVTLGYAVLAIFAFFEIRELLRNSRDENSFEVDDGILYIPLVMCLPAELPFGDGTASTAATTFTNNSSSTSSTSSSSNYYGTKQCRQLDYLIIAIAASLLFASAASVLYVFIDCMARTGCFGSLNSNASAGMGLYLSLILAQSGISTGALAEQNYYWVDYFQTVVDQLDLDWKVKSYSSSFILITTALSSFGVSFLILLDMILYRCCCMGESNSRRDEDDEAERRARMDAEDGMNRQSQKIEEAAQNSTDEIDASTVNDHESTRPPWTVGV
jgi:hypothetical protein